MAVKFSNFTQKANATTASVTEIVGYLLGTEQNVRVVPSALDTTYTYATTNGTTPALTLAGTKAGETITDNIVTLSSGGSVLLAGTGTNAISITATTYVLSATDSVVGNNNVPVLLTGLGGSNAHVDTLNVVGTGTVQVSSSGGTITIEGGATGDVTSFTNVNGGFVSASIVNTNATGDVSVGTIDLSASGTANTGTFLRGDNQWATPTDLNTTYTLPITGTVAAVTATLTGSDGVNSAVLITAGNDIDFSSITATGFTIDSSASGDTYELKAGPKAGSSVPLNLDAAAGADTSVNLTEGTGITLTQNSATEITIASTDTVTSVDEIAAGISTGIPIIVDPTTGAVEIQSMAFAGAANVGHVPTSSAVAQTTHFLRADGSWQIVGALPTKTVNTFTIVGVATNSITVTSTDNPASKDYIDVYINGVYQAKANFNALSVKTLTLAAGNFPDGAVIEAVTTT